VSDAPPPPPPPESFGAPPPSGGGADVGAALSYGFRKYGDNIVPLLVVVLAPGIIASAILLIGVFVVRGVPGILLFEVLAVIAASILQVGVYRVALQITAGEKADVNEAYSYDRWGEWIVFSIVFGLFVGIGLAACIIPGLFIIAFFGMAPFYFIDQRMSLGEAFTASRVAASSKQLALPVLLAFIVGGLGGIVCFVGALVTIPAALVAVAFLYRYAMGQSVPA
jgi:hypothetical protein